MQVYLNLGAPPSPAAKTSTIKREQMEMLRKVLTSAQNHDRMSLGLGAFPRKQGRPPLLWERFPILGDFSREILYSSVPYLLSSMNQTNALEISPTLFLAQHMVGSIGRIAIYLG